MGRRGPPPTPTVLKIARGNPGHRPINTEEPALAPPDSLAPPEKLQGRARDEWVRLAGELTEKGLLTVGDLVAFEQYCELVGDVDVYEGLVKKVGREDAHKLGYASYLLKLRTQLRQFQQVLGLTPTSRSGVKASKKAAPSDAAKKRERFFGHRGTA